MEKLPFRIVHYGANDPETTRGGVETFARRLRLMFDEVTFMTPRTLDVARVRREGLRVICDNQHVLDWPEDMPVVGFQHGVAAVKLRAAPNFGRWRLARRQARAARRPNTVWVANSHWVGEKFGRLHGNDAAHVIHYPVDVERFDARLDNEGSNLVLHDAREKHKGSRLIPRLAAAFPEWRFEPLDCHPDAVADRMRKARMFVHLSRYEGNSVVCNEAMAMNLPCFFTDVGLFRDADRPSEVYLVDADLAYSSRAGLEREFRSFISSLGARAYRPRGWILDHATPQIARAGWRSVIEQLDIMRSAGGEGRAL